LALLYACTAVKSLAARIGNTAAHSKAYVDLSLSRPHNLSLLSKDDRNFIARQLFKNIY